jgi:cephalosporin-C deacetylase-like acetyl esterase
MFLPVLALLAIQSTPPSWDTLKNAYNYPQIKTPVPFVNGAEPGSITFTFTGAPGDSVQGVLVEPTSGTHFPVVILLHGLGGNKEFMEEAFGEQLIAHGIAYAAIDVPGHGQRATSADRQIFQKIGQAFMANKSGDLLVAMRAMDGDGKISAFLGRATIAGVMDDRSLLDILKQRHELDYNKVGIIGDSLGSIMGSIFAAVDTRVKFCALEVGGDPVLPTVDALGPELRDKAYETSCSLFAAHISVPVFMLNGTKDNIMPKSATDRLYNAIPSADRTIKWYDSSHFMVKSANDDAANWVSDKLKG